MLDITSVIVDYMFKNVFSTFYRRGPANVAGPGVTYPLSTLPLDGPGCVNNCVKKLAL